MNFIITGGEFRNKGAEAMSLITIARIREVYPDARIYMIGKLPEAVSGQMRIIPMQFSRDVADYLIHPSYLKLMEIHLKNVVKGLLGRSRCNVREVESILKQTDSLIDISGFAISSKFAIERTLGTLQKLELAEKYGVRTVVMPQSFGPFDYSDASVVGTIKRVLAKCDKIYAREQEGYETLRKFGLTNVEKAYDMVLVQKTIRYDLISSEPMPTTGTYSVTKPAVAIIPNRKTVLAGLKDENLIIQLYKEISGELLNKGYHVYLIPHSYDDIELCQKIKQLSDNRNVVLIDRVMNSYEYQEMVKNFSFVIASRFHAVVHAYKVATPAVVLGWADKYQELCALCHQEQYVFDISRSFDDRIILDAVKRMEAECEKNRQLIEKQVALVQSEDYFGFLQE